MDYFRGDAAKLMKLLCRPERVKFVEVEIRLSEVCRIVLCIEIT